MRILITIMLIWSSVTAFSQEIWQLSPWAPDSSYVISAMSSGEPTWVKVDSLGVADSIYISGDSIRLRDGAGVAQLPTASTSTKGLLSSTDWNTFNGKVGGNGGIDQLAWFNGNNSLTSSSAIYRSSEGLNCNSNFNVNTTDGFKGFRRIMPGLSHGVTNKLPTDMAWGFVDYGGTNYPNFYLVGVGKTSIPVMSFDLIRLDSPTSTYLDFDCGYKSGNNVTSADPSSTLFRVKSAGAIKFNVWGNGDIRSFGALYNSAGTSGATGQVLTSQGLGAWTWTTPNTGTVTSVGINTGGGVTSVSGSPVTGSGNISLTLADQSASNELQTISTNGKKGNITLSNGGGTLNLNVNDADANATNELQNLTLTGQTLDISQGAGVTLPIIDVVQGSGITVNKLNGIATISASSAGSTEYIDPYIISSDTVGFILKNVMDTVQFIGVAGVTGESTTVSDSPTINMTLTGTNITGEIVDGSVTPAKLSQAYLTSEVDGSTTNEIQTLSISGSDLTISGAGGNTVTLPSGGGSSEWASLHYGSLAANTQTLTSSVWNTINFTGSSESNASIIDANHTNDEIEFVVAGTYRVDYRVSFIANADALIYSGIYSSVSSSVDGNTQMESDTDSGYKHTIMQHSYIKTAVAGEKIKLQVQPLIAHTSVAIYSNFIVTKL